MNFNILAILVAAFATLPLGFLWYSDIGFGSAWLKEINKTKEGLKNRPSMLVIVSCSIFFAFLLSVMMNVIVIHQNGLFSLVANMPNIDTAKVDVMVNGSVVDVSLIFRTFKHGAFHGIFAALFFVLPLFGISALYERKSVKSVGISVGYWLVTLPIMGGIICAWV